jgi:chemotaxis protein histidine kinase CheA
MNPMDFLAEFQAEAGEKLDLMASQLLRLERDATDPQPVREMFLAAHTIKGGAAMLRLTDVEALAHALEDLLTILRDQQRTLDGASADLLFQAIDQLRALIHSASSEAVGAEVDPRIADFAERLRVGGTIAEPEPQPAAQRRALVVDGSATVRELQRIVLTGAGFEVEVEQRGDLGLSRALQERFEVVVAGCELRGLHGFELVAALRQASAYALAPIILLSSDADAELARQAALAGATMLIAKGSLEEEQLTAAFLAGAATGTSDR